MDSPRKRTEPSSKLAFTPSVWLPEKSLLPIEGFSLTPRIVLGPPSCGWRAKESVGVLR